MMLQVLADNPWKKLTVYMDFLYRRKETETLDYVMFVYILCDLMSELNWWVFF